MPGFKTEQIIVEKREIKEYGADLILVLGVFDKPILQREATCRNLDYKIFNGAATKPATLTGE